MKFLMSLVCLTLTLSCVIVRGQEILRQVHENNPDGSYNYAYETSNGIAAEEQGNGGQIAQGQYQYQAPDGQVIGVVYVADQDGFHPQGAHLPTPHPIPAAIERALRWNELHPEEDGLK